MLEIRSVKTKKEQKEFIEFPLKLYKNNPYFVPPLYGDEKQLFKSDYVYYDQAEAEYFNAYRDGKMVGRISAIIQRSANEKWGQTRARFTRFDSVYDNEVSDALFRAAESWAKERGMTEIVGPLGFSDLEREGLLIDGFEELSTFEEQYNYPYYQKLIEGYGFEKDVDWVERKLRKPLKPDDRLARISELMMKKYKLHWGTEKNTAKFLKKYADRIFDLIDETYSKLYGTVPFTDGMKKMTLANFKLMLNVRYIYVILDENEKMVCFGVGVPSISKAVQKSGGRLTVPTIFRLLKAIKNPKIVDLALIGVVPEYASKGIASAVIAKAIEAFDCGVEYYETNLNLEDNNSIQNQWKNFDAVLHKRRRCYIKKIV